MEIHQNARATIPPGQIWEEKYEYQEEPENERPAPVRADILSVGVTDAAGQRLAPRLDRSKVEVADAHGLRSIELVTRWQVRINSALLAVIYVLFNAVCLILGITFVFFKGAVQTLGVSLIVGSLFSFGAFVAQFWSAAMQREAQAIDRAFDEGNQDIRYKELRRLAKAFWELSEQASKGAPPSGHDTSTSAT
jgi:hypothetical protein